MGSEPKLSQAEIQTCPRRMGEYGPWEHKSDIDKWEKVGGDRVCSFCGSWHPEEFAAFVDQVIMNGAKTVKLYFSDKIYKLYLKRPGIRNASEGAIKFYSWHSQQEHLTEEFARKVFQADKLSREQMEAEWNG